MKFEFEIDEIVYDDLTQKKAKVIGRSYKEGKCNGRSSIGVYGYWVDNNWVGGGRHPWEIWKLEKNET